jgi:uncharacterized protein
MQIKNIAGRDQEIRKLRKSLDSNRPEFIAIYGRRRVGKTFLIREFYGKQICFELVGIYNASMKEQLQNFTRSFNEVVDSAYKLQTPSSWHDAFYMLKIFLVQHKGKGKKVIFFDELPWLNTPRSGFLKHLENFWNSFGSKQNNLIIVVCGSAASWMIQHIVDAKGGLHNRLTRKIRLMPFTLSEAEAYLNLQKIRNFDHYQILQLYMALGGVPYYWSFVQGGLSAAQMIDQLFFAREAELREEYDHLFASLFNHSTLHTRAVEILAKKKKGLTRNDLLEALKLGSGGTASKILHELETSGFIQSYIPYGRKSKDALYRLSDEYTLFHLHWVAPLGKRTAGLSYWLKKQSGSSFNAWSGYSFESICLKHIEQIKSHLGIAQIESTDAPWEHRSKQGGKDMSAQIDMLIDRKDMVINLCEMKFYRDEYTIDAAYARELRRKMQVFRDQTRTKKTLFLTMVTTLGLKVNKHSVSLNATGVDMEALFERLQG